MNKRSRLEASVVYQFELYKHRQANKRTKPTPMTDTLLRDLKVEAQDLGYRWGRLLRTIRSVK